MAKVINIALSTDQMDRLKAYMACMYLPEHIQNSDIPPSTLLASAMAAVAVNTESREVLCIPNVSYIEDASSLSPVLKEILCPYLMDLKEYADHTGVATLRLKSIHATNMSLEIFVHD